ncbi:NAC domain-containing protein 69-like [Hevea brasiliensis]|uniref:NAC domain-containing protein 69-like n=1 Tax=Hevea brasiliensis TaxID=3981 RepID=UPI0025D982EA|nr:NAC domain-containing protein 69-like [Hevea brasiliensis]
MLYLLVPSLGSKIKDGQEEIGTKTFLVYCIGRTPNGVISSWKMREINATSLPENQRSFILCKLIDRSDNESYKLIDRSDNEGYLPNYNEGEQAYNMACSDSYQMTKYSSFNAGETSWSENQATYNGILQTGSY